MCEVSDLIYETCKTYLLRQRRFTLHAIPLSAGLSIGTRLISVALMITLCILLFVPRADAFETYGVTGVALITFIVAAVAVARLDFCDADRHGRRELLLIPVECSRHEEVVASAQDMNFEAPLTALVWLTSTVSSLLTFGVSYLLVSSLLVEVELKEKGTSLHAAMVVGDRVGDPFKGTSSVAMNPLIKFTTVFGLLAVELAVEVDATLGSALAHGLALTFIVSLAFAWMSFYHPIQYADLMNRARVTVQDTRSISAPACSLSGGPALT